MKNATLKFALSCSLMMSACASKELALKGELTASTSTAKMDVTAEVLDDYSDDYNVLLQINMHSRDGKWVRVDQSEIDFISADPQPFNIIVGKDLVTWAEAKAEEKRMSDYNSTMKTMGVAAAGGALAVVGVLSKSKSLEAVGTATYVGAGVYGLSKDISNIRDNVQGVKLVPEGHLYAPFAVPSMSFVKRWVLINAPTGRIGRVVKLTLKTVEGEVMTYNIRLIK
jgi:hypothetical protein